MRVSVDLRSVNHRFFNPSIKLPADLARWESDVREALRRRVTRGHVTLSARAERVAARAAVDEARFAAYVELLRSLRERHGLAGDVDVATVMRMPDVLVAGDETAEDGSASELVAIVDAAADALMASREAEGERLCTVLLERLDVVSRAVERIAERAPERLVEQRDRLREQVRVLADGVAVDEGRLAQEIAFMADRLDVQEELDRFRSHITAFRSALTEPGGEPVGKRLGFLLQEMLREANTTGSKANDSALLQDVLVIKEELERIREQVENLE
jgi:uncharacterized protein (TIGR00255 family)